MSNITIIQDDCLNALKNMDDNFVNCIVTSPPYNLGGDFHICNNGKRTSYGSYKDYSDNMPEESYQKWQVDVLNELYRVSTDNAYCFYVHKERIKTNNIISPLEWIKKTKWLCAQTVILDMSATPNVDKRRFFPTFEVLYVLCKFKTSKLNNYLRLTSVWKVKKTSRKISGHPATFDKQIPFNCISVSTNEEDIVLDCFMGTGTTGIVCKELNRNFIGIELSKQYCDIAKKRIEELKNEG